MIKTKKNLIIFMPYIGVGGVEKNLFIISNYLIKKVKNLSICTLSRDKKKRFNNKIKFISPNKKISENLNIRIKYLVCLFLLFKLFIKRKNYIVISFQANIYCILLCKLFKVQIIVRANSSPSGWSHNFLKKYIYKKIISMANEVIVNSEDFKKEMQKKFNIKVNCIYNPLNIKEIKKKSNIKIKNKFFKKTSLKLINIGRLTEQKDHLTILKAVNELKNKINIQLIIIGRGKEKPYLRNYINEKKLNNIIKIIEPNTKVYSYIKSSDLFILSSKYEGLPNVLLEAGVLKKFIISTNCPTGPREILNNGKNGLFFKTGNFLDLEKKIFFYYKNKKKLKQKTNNLYKSLFKYNFNLNLNKYWKIINKYI
tara:strand:+ start:2099 stop:3202 length:1104 start_codon:yes stop_codon:yes gene_type:complete